jgi:hypothetical protein
MLAFYPPLFYLLEDFEKYKILKGHNEEWDEIKMKNDRPG